MIALAPDLIKLFEELKLVITSYPVLSRFDIQNPTFLKTYFSAEGMGLILVHPANDIESTMFTDHLLKTGEFKFVLAKHGARLQPIAFGSQR